MLDGVDLEFSEGALHSIAEKAFARKTGARGLRSILENILLDTMFDMDTIRDKKIILGPDLVKKCVPATKPTKEKSTKKKAS